MESAASNPFTGLQHDDMLYRLLFERSAVGMSMMSLDGTLLQVNPALARMLGYSTDELAGRNVSFINSPEGIAHSFARRGKLQEQSQPHSYQVEKVYVHKSGRHISVSLTASLVRTASGSAFFIGIVQDLSDRRRLEAALERAGENERQRLGRELHEGLGQQLAGLSLLAAGLDADAGSDPHKLSSDLKRLAEIAAGAVRSCRAIAYQLAPLTEDDSNDHAGFLNALRHLQWLHGADDGPPAVTLEERCSAPLRVGYHARLQLYRMIEEAVSHGIEQARATAVHIKCVADAEIVQLTIEDDGELRRDLGSCAGVLHTLMDRATAIGARVSVKPGQRRGITLSIEMRNRAEQAERVQTLLALDVARG